MNDSELEFRKEMIEYLGRHRDIPLMGDVGGPNVEHMESQAIKRYILERVRVSAGLMVERGLMSSEKDLVTGAIRVKFESYIAGLKDEVISEVVFWPANWWEMLKEQYAPQWFLKRYPIKFADKKLSVQAYKAVCPHIEFDEKKCMEWISWRGDCS